MPATRWSSPKDIAANALTKLTDPHVPVSLSKLERAVKRAHRAFDKAETAGREQARAERERAATGPHDQAVDDEPDEEVEVAA